MAYYYDLPVIVTNVGGLPEIVDKGKSGYTIEPENPMELADVLSENLGTQKLNEMTNYIQDFKYKFSLENFIQGIESICHRI